MANGSYLSSGLTIAAVHRVLGAVCDGVDVARGAANGVASRHRQCGADQTYGQDFLEHACSP